MAGRGTDIVLGGNPDLVDDLTQEQWEGDHQKVIDEGGLFILGSESTRPGASITSSAGVPDARATPASRGSMWPWTTT
jgi:hypothetical protein